MHQVERQLVGPPPSLLNGKHGARAPPVGVPSRLGLLLREVPQQEGVAAAFGVEQLSSCLECLDLLQDLQARVARQNMMQQRRTGAGKTDEKDRAVFRCRRLQGTPRRDPLPGEALGRSGKQFSCAVPVAAKGCCALGGQVVGLDEGSKGFGVASDEIEIAPLLIEPVLTEQRRYLEV